MSLESVYTNPPWWLPALALLGSVLVALGAAWAVRKGALTDNARREMASNLTTVTVVGWTALLLMPVVGVPAGVAGGACVGTGIALLLQSACGIST